MNLQLLLSYEEELINKEIRARYEIELCDILSLSTQQIIDKINSDFCSTESNAAVLVHEKLVLDLIYTYLLFKGLSEVSRILQSNFEYIGVSSFSIIENVEIDDIPALCEGLHVAFLNSKFECKKEKIVRSKSKINLIEKGAVYTKYNIAKEIVDTTIANYAATNLDLCGISILDFACGTGRFYENIVEILNEKYDILPNDSVLNNIYAIDIDRVAVNITRLKAIKNLYKITEENIAVISSKIIFRNALIRDDIFSDNTSFLKSNDLNGLINEKFDVIVSNPPYLVLKINKNKGDAELAIKVQNEVSYFRNSGEYQYSIEGMLNYYQLSIERILSMVKHNGEIGVICPSSLFADISATKLRKHLLLKHNLRKIKYFAEKEQIFENVTQATNIFYLQKSGGTENIEIEENGAHFNIEIALLMHLFPERMEIPFITKKEWIILSKMMVLKKLKQIHTVRNRRGELDLTLFKNYITKQETPFRLVRGNMIGDNEIKNLNGEFVLDGFVKIKSVDFIKNDFKRKRLVCQQISNVGLKKRLRFVFCQETDILGNSCNYLSADEKILKKLYLLLNSTILNWRFKIASTNNHINNYELDELPIVDLDQIDENYKYSTQAELDEYVGKLYGLSVDELQFITQK